MVIIDIELLGRPNLQGRPPKGEYMQKEGGTDVRYRLGHNGSDRHEEKPAVKTRCDDVLSA